MAMLTDQRVPRLVLIRCFSLWHSNCAIAPRCSQWGWVAGRDLASRPQKRDRDEKPYGECRGNYLQVGELITFMRIFAPHSVVRNKGFVYPFLSFCSWPGYPFFILPWFFLNFGCPFFYHFLSSCPWPGYPFLLSPFEFSKKQWITNGSKKDKQKKHQNQGG